MWMWEGVCQTSKCLDTRCKERTRQLFLDQPENWNVSWVLDSMKCNIIYRMAKVERCADCSVMGVVEIQLCPMNFNRDGRFMLSRIRQLLLQQVWKTSSEN